MRYVDIQTSLYVDVQLCGENHTFESKTIRFLGLVEGLVDSIDQHDQCPETKVGGLVDSVDVVLGVVELEIIDIANVWPQVSVQGMESKPLAMR